MKNLKIFLSVNREYFIGFLIFSFMSSIVSFVFPIDWKIFLYSLTLVFFIILILGLLRFFKLKKVLATSDFAYFRNDIYEKHIGKIYKDKKREFDEINLRAKIRQDEIESLLSIWTHQIKTPLAAISLISQRYEANDIDAELIKIDDYIASILSFVKLRRSSLDYKFKSFSIERLVKDIVKRYRGFFIGKKLKLSLDIEDENIVSDPKWIGFVIEQVLFNAIKYTDKGSIYISYSNNILLIEDTGIGIKKEDIENIRKLGYSGDSNKRDANSTGMGLYLVDDILKKLGYTYDIKSELGKGTKFFLNLKRSDLIED